MNNEARTNATPPRMMTYRQVAATKLLPEHTLRLMGKAGQLPGFYVGETKKFLINYDKLIEQLQQL